MKQTATAAATQDSVPLYSVITAIHQLSALGLKAEALIAGTGISHAQLGSDRSSDQVLPFDELLTVFANASELDRRADLGLCMGEVADIGLYGAVGLAMLSASTDIDAVNIALKYQRAVLGTAVSIALHIENDSGLIRVSDRLPRGKLRRFYLEQFLAGFLRFNASLSKQPSRLRELRLSYENPGYRGRYEALFGCPVHFDCAHTDIVFNTDILGVPLPNADPLTARALEAVCDDLLRRFAEPRPVSRQTRQLLASRWHQRPGMADVARELGFDARTLRRKLLAEGRSFREIKDALRRDLAMDFLRHSDKSLREIAELVGYDEPGSFRRAFVKWTGRQPGYYRA